MENYVLIDEEPEGDPRQGKKEVVVEIEQPEQAAADQHRRQYGSKPRQRPPVNWAEPAPKIRRRRKAPWDRILVFVASLAFGSGSLLILNSNWGIAQIERAISQLQSLFTQTLFGFNAVAFWAAMVVFVIVYLLLNWLLELSKGDRHDEEMG